MAKFTEETLTSWTKPPSETEQGKLENSERMVRDAINSDEKLQKKWTETFGQGSYANNTNVRLNSDIDINVCHLGGFYYNLLSPDQKQKFGLGNTIAYSFAEFKDDVENALVKKFGRSEVKRNDKCITVVANTNRIETDVVPTWEYRHYYENGSHAVGTVFFTDTYDTKTVNYPKQHIRNGINKNDRTSRKFKRLTRLHRKLRYKMIDEKLNISGGITSFLLECLVWNIPDSILIKNETWNEKLKSSIVYIYENTETSSKCEKWTEVSDELFLFHSGRKWTNSDVNVYMQQLWTYLEY